MSLFLINLIQSAVHTTTLQHCLKLSWLCVHVCDIVGRIPHADASFHVRGTHERVTSASVVTGDDCLAEHVRRKSVQTEKLCVHKLQMAARQRGKH